MVRFYLRRLNRLEVGGLEHLPPGGGVVILSNHLSAVDVVVLPLCALQAYPDELPWQPAKAELFGVPLLGFLIRKLRAFPVRRGGHDFRAMWRLVDLMRESKVILYPEGTRSRDGRLGRGQRIVGRLLHLARPRVIPAAIRGTARMLPPGRIWPRLGSRIEVRFGPPLELGEEFGKPLTREVCEQVMNKVMAAIGELLAEGAHPERVSA
ncbi:MAG: lysophospholipid acyltransferase family protein [Nitrospinota bacterium]